MIAEHQILLASQSPRRLSLLEGAGFVVSRVAARAEPALRSQGNGEQQAIAAALAKLPSVGQALVQLSADTVVHLDHHCLGKPKDAAHALTMLKQLAGKTHAVTTAVALRKGDDIVSFCVTSGVRFRALSTFEIKRYIASGEPMDKAGAYGIQGYGAGLVESVEGSHTAVVGLPMTETLQALDAMGVRPR